MITRENCAPSKIKKKKFYMLHHERFKTYENKI